MKMFKRIKKCFTKAEEVEVPEYQFTEFDRSPIDVRIKGRVVGFISYDVVFKVWVFRDKTNHGYTSKDNLKIAFKLNSLNS